jgi:hypothetical protein
VKTTFTSTEPGISRRIRGAFVLVMFSASIEAQDMPCSRIEPARDCFREAVHAHVRTQFGLYGPLSKDREYFGFVYVLHGKIESAVAKGRRCRHHLECPIDTSLAVPFIPVGAKVLGEWHTHPQESAAEALSPEDVRGAHKNHRIRCYAAFYSEPDGDIYAWDAAQSMVPDAMASRSLVGNYVAERPQGADRTDTAANVSPP